MKKIYILVLFLTSCTRINAQNLISNGDFELYSGCPTGSSEVEKAILWQQVVDNADYYNCSFYPDIIDSLGFSGTGYVGFGMVYDTSSIWPYYGESFGQNLSSPTQPMAQYSISFAATKTDSGFWSNSCGKIGVFGFDDTLIHSSAITHPSVLLGSILLAESPIIGNNQWQSYTVHFTAPSTLKSIAFTGDADSTCYVYLFIDSINLRLISLGVEETDAMQYLSLSQNPNNGNFVINYILSQGSGGKLEIYNLLGEKVYEQELKRNSSQVQQDLKLAQGFYLCRVVSGNEMRSVKFVVE